MKFTITEEMRDRLIAAQMPPEEEVDGEEGIDENTEEVSEEEGEVTEQQTQEIELDIPPPYWQNGEKIIEMRKIDGQWKIDGIVFVKSIEPEQDESD